MDTKTAMSETQFLELIELIVKAHPDPSTRGAALVTAAGCDYSTANFLIGSLKANLGMLPPAPPAAPAAVKYAPPAFVPPKGHYKIDGKDVQVKVGKTSKLPYFVVNDYYAGALAKPSNAWALEALSTPEKAEAALVAYAQVTGKCGICNTKLTDPKSIADGIGPVCKKNLYKI